jgi:TolB-like protein
MGGVETGPGAREVKTLAVLPFRSLTEGQEKSYLGLGIADALISRVSQDPNLVVRPTSTVRRYATDESSANAGRELHVDAVLEGTWVQEAGRLRVTANLLRVADGASLWSDRFDAASGDLFAVQDEISERLAERLRMRLASPAGTGGTRGGTRNAQAYEAFSKGLYYFSERGFTPDQRGNSDQATLLFAEAARLDPGFARAHAQLAYSLVWTALYIDQDSTLIERAQAELAEAERLEPTLGLVPLVRSQILYSRYMGWRIEEGIAQLERARALDPSLGALETSDFAIHLGLVDEWRKGMDRALEEDPTNRRIRMTYTHNAYLLSLPELFLKLQKDLLGEEPDYRYWIMTNDAARAAPDMERYALDHPADPTNWVDVAAARAMQGRCREADSLLRVVRPAIAPGSPLPPRHIRDGADRGEVRQRTRSRALARADGAVGLSVLSAVRARPLARADPQVARVRVVHGAPEARLGADEGGVREGPVIASRFSRGAGTSPGRCQRDP